MKETIEEIEKNYPVETVEYKGMQVWPFLRIYISDKFFFNDEPIKPGFSLFGNFFLSFFYGLGNLFRKYDYLIFSSSDQRKKINGKYIDKSIDKIAEICEKTIVFELPVGGHYNRSKISTRHISSKYIIYAIVLLIQKLFLWRSAIKNQNIIDEIMMCQKVNFNYKSLIKRHYAQYLLSKLLIKIYKPKAVFFVCYYTNMGFIKAFKEKGIKVIEVQHGVINNSHDAYNVHKPLDKQFFPDYLLTFGNTEKKVFDKKNFFITAENVIPVGHSYIDYIKREYQYDEKFRKLSGKYNRVIAVTSQNIDAENKFVNFLKSSAALDKTNLFVFIPRNSLSCSTRYEFPENIIIIDWLGTYEIITQSHFHSTMYSTCAIEAPSLGVQNILININNYSKIHYSSILDNSAITKYVNTPEEYLFELKNFKIIPKDMIIESNKENIFPNYNENILKALNKIFQQ